MSETFPDESTPDAYLAAARRATTLRRLRARDYQRRLHLAASSSRAAHAATLAAGRPRP